ncbi:GGDEF domain-containing protein [Hydrogenobacter thermophilus]|uniref:GGDEF domain-containing protein n=1 Tax=Hydrogenobacter thermophilus TaxID=940 RepID=UPI0030F858A2
MTYDQYLAIGFAVLFASLTVAFKNSVTKRLSAIFSVSFMLQAVTGFFNNKPVGLLLLFYSYLLLSIAFFYGVSLTKTMRSLKNKAYTDTLTQVSNRTFLEDVLKRELKNYERLGVNYCVLFVDLYNFKKINDTYGHATGDQVLAEMGKRLKRHVRSDDFVVRYGGDEFLIVMKDVNEDKINSVIDRLRAYLTFNVGDILVQANIGYAFYPKDGNDLDQLIRIASIRMYEDKKLYEKGETS